MPPTTKTVLTLGVLTVIGMAISIALLGDGNQAMILLRDFAQPS